MIDRGMHRAAALLGAVVLVIGQAGAADRGDANALLRADEAAHSQVLDSVHMLADVYGPRLTGSPEEKAAAEWAIARMKSWGATKVYLEPWDLGHPGWRNLHAAGEIVTPTTRRLAFGVAAWTPGTKGPLAGDVVLIAPPEKASAVDLDAYLQSVADKVRGRIVMVGRAVAVRPEPIAPAIDAELVAALRKGEAVPPDPEPPTTDLLTRRQRSERIDAFLLRAGALLRIDDARRPYGVIAARANLTLDLAKSLPAIILANEEYGRIARLLGDGRPVRMRFDIENEARPEWRTAYNAVAEIPGTDKADELVILGAHLDSWHTGYGAVDNGVGCAIMMEVARLLQATGLHPRRSIRIILWSGEEQYLLGSQDYVARHFGTAEAPGPEFGKLAAYINMDNGSGAVRGANIFGPPEAASMIRTILAPFADLGVVGAIPHNVRRMWSTDATTFSRAGLPAIGLIQDPLDYDIAWHDNLDTFERVDEAQAKQAATIAAALAFALATSNEKPARFDRAAMPVPVGAAPAASKR